MIDFILEIDWLTTKEFCDKYSVPHPVFTGQIKSSADQFLRIDVVKQKMFVEYAKFLNKKLTIEMFEGERKIFIGGQYIDRQPSTNYNTYEILGKAVFKDSNTTKNSSLGLKINDLVSFGITYIER